jgi:hypothetical protein
VILTKSKTEPNPGTETRDPTSIFCETLLQANKQALGDLSVIIASAIDSQATKDSRLAATLAYYGPTG